MHLRQDFYNDILEQNSGDYRKLRFIELGRKEGLPAHKLEQTLDEGRVPSKLNLASVVWEFTFY